MLKSIGNLIWGGEQDPTVATLSSGQLFKRSTKKRKTIQELVFKDAQAAIRRTSTQYQYQLIVSPVYEEGEAELLEEQGHELPDEEVHLLDVELKFHMDQSSGNATFIWCDPSSETDEWFDFVVDKSVSSSAITSFERSALQCMYERQHNHPYTEATADDLAKLKYVPRNESDAAADKMSLPPPRDAPVDDVTPVCEVDSQLFLFNPSVGTFQLQTKNVSVKLVAVAPYTYWIYIEDDARCWLRQPIEPGMNAIFNREQSAFIWCYYDESNRVFSLSLRFPDPSSGTEFREAFGRCAYETMNLSKFEKISKADQGYLLDAYKDDVTMTDVESVDEDEEEERSEEEEEEEEEKEVKSGAGHDEDEDEDEEENAVSALGRQAKNSQLAVGYKHDRSFVVRGNKIGVFKYTDDDKLKFSTAINNVSTLKGDALNPNKVMLHNEDSNLIMMDPSKRDTLYKMDLEYGKVVEEWHVHDDIPCTSFVPDSKYAQMTQQQTLIGLSNNSLFRLDPRLSGQKLVDAECKSYVTKNGFSCAATTEQGWVAVGSEKGELRLFNKLGINAKAALPAIGDPIIGIDVTADGRWLVATCRSYLLLVDCWNQDEGTSGYVKGFSKDKKPVPKRLQLKPEHVAYMGAPVSFTVARFNTGINEHEKTIVTSTGPYVITWNFRRVKQGKLYDYQIKQYGEDVVADNFKYGQDRNIIVALPDDVQMASKRSLLAPKKALQTSTAEARTSKSDIVNAPY